MGALLGSTLYYVNLPDHLSQHETIVLGQRRLIPGAQAALRVVVRDSRDATPLPNATVNVLMRPQDGNRAIPLFEGRTDGDGNIDVTFTVPENAAPEQMLIIETRSDLGSDSLEHPVRVRRDYRIHLSTDKPLYQAGDVIHIRALALSAFDRRPAAEQPLDITVADARGNVVFRQTLTTSQYGVAATDFQLANEVNDGPYQLTATLDERLARKTVTVLTPEVSIASEPADLSTFDINMTTDRDFYRPGERVTGALHADYAFGKPVANGDVTILGSPGPMISATVHLTGQTDASGNFDFAFDLPAYANMEEPETDQRRFHIEAQIVDAPQHAETQRLSLPISAQGLIIEAVPEGGQLHPGVENILYVLTQRPDGTPVKSDLTVRIAATEEMFTVKTGPYGLAEVHFTPQAPSLRLDIEARAPDGATAQRAFDFAGAAAEESVLLRPDAPLYRVGDTMRLTILTSEPAGAVYLDIAREGQTATPSLTSRSVPVVNGQAETVIDLTPDLFGTLHLHAYKILRSGETVRDTRMVVVEPTRDLNVTLTSSASVYRPGDTATLQVQVTDAEGAGLPAELGLAIVDESTFTPIEHDPDIATLALLLGEELLTPKYELQGLGLPDMIGTELAAEPALREAQLSTAEASLATVAPAASPFTLRIDSQAKTMERASTRQSEALADLSLALTALFLLIPWIILALNGVAMWRTAPAPRHFWRRASLAAGAVLAFTLLLSALPMAQSDDAGTFERLTQLFEELAGQGSWLRFLTLVGGSGFVAASIFAAREQDRALALTLRLILLFAFIVGDLLFVSMQLSDGAAFAWPTLLALIVLAVGLLLRAVDFILARRLRPAAALSAVAIFLLVGAPALLHHGSDVWQRDDATATSAADVEASEAQPSLGQSPEETASTTSNPPARINTLLWLPSAITNESGALQVDLPVADSITTWRVSALASAQDGRLGSATSDLRVFQDFFTVVDLPPALTVGDQISVPVAIYNYLPEPQTLQLEVEQARWFELLGAASREIDIAPNDVTTTYFPIRVLDFGLQPFQVTGWGSAMSDALRKEVRVVPNGKERRLTRAGLVTNAPALSETLTLPDTAIPGTQALTVKLIPGVVSQLVESLDALQRLPTGGLEPTVSAAYPAVLLLDYLQATGQTAPELRAQAEAHVDRSYQRLTTFETPDEPGGFSRYGQAPADPLLTAYGLQVFSQMQRVHPIDPALVDRMAAWLFEHQRADGSWASAAGISETERLPATAFVLWGLADAGYASDARAQQAAEFLLASISEAEETPGYTLALVANALVAMDVADEENIPPATANVLQRLSDLAIREGDAAYWESGRATYLGSTGTSADTETTALAALALFRAERHVAVANAAVRMLIQNKDSFGAWHTPPATAMALKALLASAETDADSAESEAPVTVNVTLNESEIQSATLTLASPDAQPTLAFEEMLLGAENTVDIQIDEPGAAHFMYQIVGRYYLPWDEIAAEATTSEAILLNVAYDRTELNVDETTEVAVTAMLNPVLTPAGAPNWATDSTIIEVGIPPGFEVRRDDLGQIVSRSGTEPDDATAARVERCELAKGRIILYVTHLTSREPLTFTYRLRAKFPVVAQTPASHAYDVYNPTVIGEDPPQTLTVNPTADE